MAFEGLAACAAAGDIPQAHGLVRARRGQRLAVGAERHAQDRLGVARKGAPNALDPREDRKYSAAGFDGGLGAVGLKAQQRRQLDVLVELVDGFCREAP